jgi:hypothetical protein
MGKGVSFPVATLIEAAVPILTETHAKIMAAFGGLVMLFAVLPPLSATPTLTRTRARTAAVRGLAVGAFWFAKTLTILVATSAREADSVFIITTTVNATSSSAASSTIAKATAKLFKIAFGITPTNNATVVTSLKNSSLKKKKKTLPR